MHFRHEDYDRNAEKTLAAWEQTGVSLLKSELPEVLSSEIDRKLPEQPKDLIQNALADRVLE